MPIRLSSPVGTPRWLLPVLVILFFFSGLSALIYQTLWLRLLSLVFGVTVHAASTVLASFMGGLAIGSLIAGRVAERSTMPLVLFGTVELLIGMTALASIPAFDAVRDLYVQVHRGSTPPLVVLTLVRLALSAAVLIVPTALMGATLPLVLRSSLGSAAAIGSRVSLLYGSNTSGAIAGALLAGFYLVPSVGLRSSFLLAAAINTFVGISSLVAALVVRAEHRSLATSVGANGVKGAKGATGSDSPGKVEVAGDGAEGDARLTGGARRLVLLVFALSGFTSLALEVVWFRAFVIFLRPTTYAFTLMLACVLGGIALGSLLATPFMRRNVNWLLVLGVLEAMAALVALSSFAAMTWPSGQPAIRGVLSRIVPGYVPEYLVPLLAGSVAAIVPTALLWGAAFPIGLQLWVGDRGSAKRVGVFYSVNVCGAILGSLAAGFLFLPALGSRGSLIALSGSTLLAGAALLLVVARTAINARLRVVATASLVVAVALFMLVARRAPDPFDLMATQLYPGEQLLWKEEGVQTSVSVHSQKENAQAARRIMYLDGAHQANDGPGMVFVHRRLGALSLAIHPRARQALVIGLGGGATPGVIGQFSDVQVDVVELSAAVIHGAEWFNHVNYQVLRQPNVTVRVDDGRNHLLLTDRKYDVITADIIPPRHAGAGALYSREYFTLVRNALADDGVAIQWNGGETDEVEYKLILRTFLDVFEHTTVWAGGSVMAGSRQPLRLDRQALERRLAEPLSRAALQTIGVNDWERLLKMYVAGPDELRRYVGPGSVLTDDRPLLEYFLSLPANARPADLTRLHGDVNRHIGP